MGLIWSRWRKKPTTLELLEKIDQDITALEKAKQGNVASQRHIIGSLLLYSVLGYIVAVVVFYAWYLPEIWPDRILYSLPLIAFPFLIWAIKLLLHWYFVKRISKKEHALEELKEKKNTILEEVMEKETYKKAKEILDRFDPDRHSPLEPQGSDASPLLPRARDGQELRRRNVPGTATPPAGMSPVPGRSKQQQLQQATPAPSQMSTPMMPPPSTAQKNGQPGRAAGAPGITPGMRYPPPPGPPMPRPILPRDRSFGDRMLEVLIGDGPQNRYALICSECYSHNGMALKEEFEYFTFRCCYCYTLNPARKERPKAPRLSFSKRLRETENRKQQEAQSKMQSQSKKEAKSKPDLTDSDEFTDDSFVKDAEAKPRTQSAR